MQILSKVFRGLLIIMIISGMAATLEAEEVKLKIKAPWEAAGRVFKVGPELLQFHGIFQGIMYIDDGKGKLDSAVFICPASQDLNATNGQTVTYGRCMISESDADSVYAEFTCKGDMDGCVGKFKITGGEGHFKGETYDPQLIHNRDRTRQRKVVGGTGCHGIIVATGQANRIFPTCHTFKGNSG
jgi:hypothetical protein